MIPSWKRFQVPKGWTSIDGVEYGGLQKIDLFRSAIDAWENNGRKNGWGAPDLSTSVGAKIAVDNGVGTAGFFNIPICGYKEMFEVFTLDEKGRDNNPGNNPYWPCKNVS